MIGIYFYEYLWNTRLFLLMIRKNLLKWGVSLELLFFCKMDVVGLTLIVAYKKSFLKVQLLIMFDTYFT